MDTRTPRSKKPLPLSIGYRKQIALRLCEKDENAIRRIAENNASTATQVCRQAVREFLASHPLASK